MKGRDSTEFTAALALGALLGASVALFLRQVRNGDGGVLSGFPGLGG